YDMLLSNTEAGYGHVATLSLEKTFPFGLYVVGTYAFEDVHEVSPAMSSRSVSNYWIVAVVDPQNPSDAASYYERAHRFTLGDEFSRTLIGDFTDETPWKTMKTTIG